MINAADIYIYSNSFEGTCIYVVNYQENKS